MKERKPGISSVFIPDFPIIRKIRECARFFIYHGVHGDGTENSENRVKLLSEKSL